MTFKVYGDAISGNCQKVKFTADYLGLDYEWVEVDILAGETRTEEFRQLNPAAQAPVVVFPDGRALAQSNAIILHLAEGAQSDLIPREPFARAKLYEWLFWEQYSHETAIAVRRFHKKYLQKLDSEINPALMEKGRAALSLMEARLSETAFFLGGDFSLADISLVAYTRLAPEGGFSLEPFPSVRSWITRVERALGLDPEQQA